MRIKPSSGFTSSSSGKLGRCITGRIKGGGSLSSWEFLNNVDTGVGERGEIKSSSSFSPPTLLLVVAFFSLVLFCFSVETLRSGVSKTETGENCKEDFFLEFLFTIVVGVFVSPPASPPLSRKDVIRKRVIIGVRLLLLITSRFSSHAFLGGHKRKVMYEGTLFNERCFVFEFFSAFSLFFFRNFFASFKKRGPSDRLPGAGIQTHSPSFKCHKSKEK